MSITVNSRQTLIDWCMRKLGWPVIEINVDDDQIEDRIDEGLQLFQEYHFDGVEKTFVKHQITADNIANGWISISDSITSVTRVWPIPSGGVNTGLLFNVNFQIFLSEIWNLSSSNFYGYVLTKMRLRDIENLFVGEMQYRFNRKTDKLYLDIDWNRVTVGQYCIIECWAILDPETYTQVYNDRLLKEYCTQLIKRQWGANLSKFSDMKLPGGYTLNGPKIYEDADARCKEIEERVQTMYELPAPFLVG